MNNLPRTQAERRLQILTRLENLTREREIRCLQNLQLLPRRIKNRI